MKYSNIEPITKDVAEATLTNVSAVSRSRVLDTLLSITQYVNDLQWVEGQLLKFSFDRNDEIRRMACICLGHFVRIHGYLHANSILRLRELVSDLAVVDAAENALEDVQQFIRSEPGKSLTSRSQDAADENGP